jgi:uncharacterized protein involved in exopolysaccharide biosynthesis
MNFSKFETIMKDQGVHSLAEIARSLETTPQAVSNWKARDQVPYHIINRVNRLINPSQKTKKVTNQNIESAENKIAFSDILLVLGQQLKLIALILFITVFSTFTYVKFVVNPEYVSSATLLLPQNSANAMSGLAGLANQIGVNVNSQITEDLSSPTFYPELLKSRRFAEKILFKNFFVDQSSSKKQLIKIILSDNYSKYSSRDELINSASAILNDKYLYFDKDPSSAISKIVITAPTPKLSKDLADTVLVELDLLNRYFKTQITNEKISFINLRIESVKNELENSEIRLKEFNQQNRQVNSPALQLDLDRLTREVEVQKGIFLTLKQQLELAKIEEVQEASIVQVLDYPELPYGPINKNLTLSILFSISLGAGLGILLAFLRSYFYTSDISERKKLRKVKYFFKKKAIDLYKDYRISGTVSILMLLAMPIYFLNKSTNPIYFGYYSLKALIMNSIYLIILFLSTIIFISSKRKNN